MSKDFLRREWFIWIAIIAPFIFVAFIWNQIPETIPTHFNAKGEPDDYGNRAFGTLLLPGMNIFFYFILLFIPRIDPRYNNYAQFQKAFYAIRLVIHGFFTLLSFAIIHTALTGALLSIRFIPVFAFLMIAILGYYMPKVKSNFFVGIRTPWTLSSETVWKKTHEFGGKVMLYTGLATCILLLAIPMSYSLYVIFPAVFIISVVPIAYSYMEYRKSRQEEKP